MKKLISLFLLCVFAVSLANADIYTSVSRKYEYQKKEKAPIKLNWYGLAGINVGVTNGNIYNYDEIKFSTTTIGLDLNAGFYSFFRPSYPSDFYWGVDMSVGLNLFRLNDSSSHNDLYYCKAQNFFMPYLNIAPQLGFLKDLSNSTKLNIHFEPMGMYVTSLPDYTYYSSYGYEYEGECMFDCPIDGYSKVGFGILHKNIIYDISYRQPWFWFPGTITVGVGIQF